MSNRKFSTPLIAAALMGGLAMSLPAYAQTAVPPEPTTEQAPSAQPAQPDPQGAAQPVPAPVAPEAEQPQTELQELAAEDGPDPALPHDLSPVGMFLAADYVVKGVMIALALASVATWSILLFKVFELSAAKARLRRARVRRP